MLDDILDEIAAEAGWNTDSKLALCLEYIGRQQDDATFEDFLQQQLAAEQECQISDDSNSTDCNE